MIKHKITDKEENLMGIRGNIRRDPKRRILRAGESIRADGK